MYARRKLFEEKILAPPHSINQFVFDLQRFDLSDSKITTGDNKSVFSCEVNGATKYGTAAEFTTDNIGSATKITLLEDFTAPGHAEITISSNCTLDLAGKTLTLTGETFPAGTKFNAGETVTNLGNAFTVADGKTCTLSAKFVVADGATFTLIDSGKNGQIVNDDSVGSTNNWPSYAQSIVHVGTSTGENAKFIMNSGTIKAGDNGVNIKKKGVAIMNGGTIISGNPDAYAEGSTIKASGNSCVFPLSDCVGSEDNYNFVMTGGTLITHSENRATIQSQGNSLAYIKLEGGEIIREYTPLVLPPAAIYASYVGKIVVSGTAHISSVTTGIEIRMGELEITGGTIESTADNYTLYPFNSGETNTGSAVSVDQHNSQRKITVNISGGELLGPVALSTANPQKNLDFGKPAETVSPKSGGEIVNGKLVVGTVSINITGGTFKSTSTDTERKITTREENYTDKNGKTEPVKKYTFIGKNAIFNADDRLDISISGATIEGDLATITDSRDIETIAKPRTSPNGGYTVGDNITYVGVSTTTPKDYNNLISYSLDDSGNGIVIPEGWNYFDGWKGYVNDKDGFSKIALYVDDDDISLDDLKYDSVGRTFAISKGIKAQWSGQFAHGGGSYYLAELDYNDNATAVTVSSETAGAMISGGILSNKVKKIDATDNNVALAIQGNSLDNIIMDGKGNDSLTGGGGKNIFVYSAGEDIILDYAAGDKASLDNFEPIVNAASITTQGDNLVLNFDDQNKLTFQGFSSLTAANVLPTTGVSVEGSRKAYVYTAYSVADANFKGVTLNGAAGNSFTAINPFVTIDGSAVDSAFNIGGTKDNNYIIAGKGGGSLNGNGGNDTLVGGDGADIFVYAEGKDVIKGYNSGDLVDIDTNTIAGGKLSNDKLKFTIGKGNSLTFNPDDNDNAVEKVLLQAGGFLTKDGAVNDAKTFKLFSGTNGRIELGDKIYVGAVESIDATAAKNSVTLTATDSIKSITFGANKKTDLFEYGGGTVSISGYEAGKDKINIAEVGAVSLFTVDDNGVSINTGRTDVISIQGAKDKEILIRDGGNSYSKFVLHDDGVLYNKAKRPTEVKIYSNAGNYTADSSVKKIFLQEGVAGISVTSGNNKTTLDASAANGVSLIGGAKNNKFIGSNGADTFVYSGGKDIIENYSANEQISLGAVGKLKMNDNGGK